MEFDGTISRADAEALVKNQDLNVLQTSRGASAATWDILNEYFLPMRPDVLLRIYRFCSECDLAFLKRIQNVRKLSVDGFLMTAHGIEQVASLPFLETLRVGIYDFVPTIVV